MNLRRVFWGISLSVLTVASGWAVQAPRAAVAPPVQTTPPTDPDLAADCNNITPRGNGRSDHKAISNCLCTQRVARLTAGTFVLKQPVTFPRKAKTPDPANCKFSDPPAVTLTGQGSQTVVTIASGCVFPSDVNNANATSPVLDDSGPAGAATITNFTLDLSNLQQSCSPNRAGNFAIRVENAPGTEVGKLTIRGSLGGGASTMGGIQLINSPNSRVHDNVITDIGYATRAGASSADAEAIQIGNSGTTQVTGNRITHVAFGIEVNNYFGPGYDGDSSGSTVLNNTILGSSHVTSCGPTSCIGGRAFKMQGFPSAPVLRKLTVSNNTACDFGGMTQNGQLLVNTSGLDLIGVQDSTFTGNVIDSIGKNAKCGTQPSAAEFGLQLRPVLTDSVKTPAQPLVPSRNNTFTNNYFRSGCGGPGCGASCTGKCDSNGCADVNFNAQLNGNASQVGLSSGAPGSNDFRNCRP
ncbi:MAG TPA: hypothetical protein VF173_28260 [Thermoanaerobaculia bacterium]|nr:hypothetical protein [Thermoanaerobaculia bacterium]